MKREIAVCDRCGKSAETPEEKKTLDLHKVILGTQKTYNYFGGEKLYADHANWEKDWCLECRKATGLAVVMEKAGNNLPKEQVPTLEDMIREIVRQELT